MKSQDSGIVGGSAEDRGVDMQERRVVTREQMEAFVADNSSEVDERTEVHDLVLAYLDGLEAVELRALARRLASIARGRELLRRLGLSAWDAEAATLRDVGGTAFDDVIAYLELTREVRNSR